MIHRRQWQKIAAIAGAIVAVVGAWVALEQVGARPALNGEVEASELRLQQQVGTLEVLILQNERRYWEEQLAEARAEAGRDPSNGVVQARIREIEATLRDIQRRLESARS